MQVWVNSYETSGVSSALVLASVRENIETIYSVIFTSCINIAVHCHQTLLRNSNIPPLRTFSEYTRVAQEIWEFDVWCVSVWAGRRENKNQSCRYGIDIFIIRERFGRAMVHMKSVQCDSRWHSTFHRQWADQRLQTVFFAKLKKNNDRTK